MDRRGAILAILAATGPLVGWKDWALNLPATKTWAVIHDGGKGTDIYLDALGPITAHCGSESVTITADEIMAALRGEAPGVKP